MNDSGDHTHRARAIDPARFRALATGIGQSAARSEATGASRAQRVVECTPPAQRAATPAAEGYPAPLAEQGFGPASAMASRRWGR